MNTKVLLLAFFSTITCVSACMYIKFFTENMLLGSIITFIIFLIIFSIMSSTIKNMFNFSPETKKEGFTSMNNNGINSKDYANATTRSPLPLEDIYPANIPFKNTDETYETMWKEYPSFPAKSNQTNLIKHWDNPSNGTCMLPHQCGAFYKKITPAKDKKPTPPSWGSGIRVNFYDTCSFAKK